MRRHRDGRIRDASQAVDGELFYALDLIRQKPSDPRVQEISNRLTVRNFLFSLPDAKTKAIAKRCLSTDLDSRMTVEEAVTIAKLAGSAI